MECEFCRKITDGVFHKWTNFGLQEEYNLCDECFNELKGGCK